MKQIHSSSPQEAHREDTGFLTERLAVPRWAVGLAGFLLIALLFVAWSLLRTPPAHLQPDEVGSFSERLPTIVGVTQSRIVEGNSAEIIQDAQFFDRLLVDVEGATETVHFETYVWWQGEICSELSSAFARAAERGVTVQLLVDALGGRQMDGALRQTMVDAGVAIHEYHPVRLTTLGRLNNRDHRKLAILDGRIGYTFGHGAAEEWDDVGSEPWRDTAVRIEGPLVADLQSTFLDNWIPSSGEVPTGPEVFPQLDPVGQVRGHVVMSSTLSAISVIELLYKLAIASAQEEILIQNPYFVPETGVIDLIVDAVERGVKVRLMVPSPEVTDSSVVLHASHTRYPALLRAGVEILEYEPTFLHQKIMVVDRLWSHVGSSNFDSRSLEINDEISVGLIDRDIARTLIEAFEDDARHCRKVDSESWHRSWGHRLLDRSAALLQEQI